MAQEIAIPFQLSHDPASQEPNRFAIALDHARIKIHKIEVQRWKN